MDMPGMSVSPYEGGSVQRSSGGGLVDVIDTILDKGLVIDAFVNDWITQVFETAANGARLSA